ncbi:MAG: DUF120 domain-containing protein [Candidatus Hermodarchaeota archaeon]
MSFYQDPRLLSLLIVLAKMGALRRFQIISTEEFGTLLGCSQQTASRWLSRLENQGYISRTRQTDGRIAVRISSEGIKVLSSAYQDLNILFRSQLVPESALKNYVEIYGTVVTGLGEGKYYMSLPGYEAQFLDYLGWVPYQGTLNLRLTDPDDFKNLEILFKTQGFRTKEFEYQGRRFGVCRLWYAKLFLDDQNIRAAIIKPERTHHLGTIEILAEKNLREAYAIKDGMKLKIHVYY